MSIRRTVKTPPLAALAIALSAPWLGALAAPPPGAPQGPDSQALEQIAQRVVTQSAAVGDGDVVLISGRMQDAELMEDIAVNVARAGGQPLIAYGSDRLSKRMFFDVPAKYDDRADTWGMQMADMVDVFISLGNGTSEALLEGADPARLAARNKANAPVTQAIMKNNVRRVELGNNLYPTPWRAERFGMEEAALSKMFWNGINVDYGQLQARGAEVKAALAGGDRIRITHPNGTDLSMRVQGRPVGVSDGIISQEDRKAGGAAVGVYLPAGEVYTTPVPGSTNGTLVDSGSWFNGKRIDKLTLKVVDGKVTEMSGSGPGYAGLKAQYDAVGDARKDQFGYVDFGINPNIALPAGSKSGNWVPAGAVTVGTGANDWAGGDNDVPFGINVFLPGSTVTMDGKAVVEDGELKI